MIVDLRSDTFTKPTPEMLSAMFEAEVGDDVFGEDPSINALESKVAALFGMEAALFCPSGTMTNQIAVRVHTRQQDEVICDYRSHIYQYEGGGMASNSGVNVRLLDGNRGRLTASQILASVNPDDDHKSVTRLVALENTVNRGGGSYYQLEDLMKIKAICDEKDLLLHLDGARLFNALTETGDTPEQFGLVFDSISICLSKGLGAPVGSLLISNAKKIRYARRVRKAFGGGMRQAGYLAAAGIYALDHHIDRLKEDHIRAREIGTAVERLGSVSEVYPIDTNIIIFKLDGRRDRGEFLAQLSEEGILALPFGPGEIRMITHLDITDQMVEKTIDVLTKLDKESVSRVNQ